MVPTDEENKIKKEEKWQGRRVGRKRKRVKESRVFWYILQRVVGSIGEVEECHNSLQIGEADVQSRRSRPTVQSTSRYENSRISFCYTYILPFVPSLSFSYPTVYLRSHRELSLSSISPSCPFAAINPVNLLILQSTNSGNREQQGYVMSGSKGPMDSKPNITTCTYTNTNIPEPSGHQEEWVICSDSSL